jgi:hypothetical protein
MRTGVSYMGQHDPKFLDLDMREMQQLGLNDVLLAAQENDFIHFTGKLDFTSGIARQYGLRPLAIFWGLLNLFGGGRSSQFLLENPSGFQVTRDGAHSPAGCYMNPLCRARIKEMITIIAEKGFAGYFVDEPTPLRDCYCPSCRARFDDWYGGDLRLAPEQTREAFRQRCVIEYVTDISRYCKQSHPHLETICCLMPHDHQMWQNAAEIPDLDNLGTDLYWVNTNQDVEEMAGPLQALDAICKQTGKIHHEWLQCWRANTGNEPRILEQGKILLRQVPDALYVWAWKGQIGTTESCEDPATAWKYAEQVLRMAKEA